MGRIVYFSLTNLLVRKEVLTALCAEYGVPCTNSGRIALSDAFRSATSSVSERVQVEMDGEMLWGKVSFRDNQRTQSSVSRELVLEITGSDSNRYVKLANVSFDKKTQAIRCDNVMQDAPVDVLACCSTAQERFERFRSCAGRRKIETICTNYLSGIQAAKLSGNAHLYFVPQSATGKAEQFVSFLKALSKHSESGTPISIIHFPLLRDEEQCEQMAAEFCAALRKEMDRPRERAEYLLRTDSQSPTIMERWIRQIGKLEKKCEDYERVLGRKLSDLDMDFAELNELSQELSRRSRKIRSDRAA